MREKIPAGYMMRDAAKLARGQETTFQFSEGADAETVGAMNRAPRLGIDGANRWI
jgi:hypothetical protein